MKLILRYVFRIYVYKKMFLKISIFCEIKQMNASRSNFTLAQNVVKYLAILINRETFFASS